MEGVNGKSHLHKSTKSRAGGMLVSFVGGRGLEPLTLSTSMRCSTN
jgi:hypothetical protein